MNQDRVEEIINLVLPVAEKNTDISALAVTGSWARGAARPDSDLDIVFLVPSPDVLRGMDWLRAINWASLNLDVESWRDEDMGTTWSRFVRLSSGDDIEFAIESTQIIDCNNVETLTPFAKGLRILLDKEGKLKKIEDALRTIRPEANISHSSSVVGPR